MMLLKTNPPSDIEEIFNKFQQIYSYADFEIKISSCNRLQEYKRLNRFSMQFIKEFVTLREKDFITFWSY